MARNKTLAVMD